MRANTFVQSQRKLTARALRTTLLVERRHERRRIAHEVVIDCDGLAVDVGIDVADADDRANVAGEEGIVAIDTGVVLAEGTWGTSDELEAFIARGGVVDTEVSDERSGEGNTYRGRCESMVLELANIVLSCRHGFAEEDVGVEVGEDTSSFRFARNLPLASRNVDRIAKLAIEFLDLEGEVDRVVLKNGELIGTNT